LHETKGFFDIDGVRLEYQRLTPFADAGPTLVFLHEGLGCVALWKEFPRQIAKATGCPVLSYSRAGYGGSDACALPRPLSFMHDEAQQVLPKILAAADIRQAVLIGHSDGASIALIHAGSVTDQRLRGLILMAPHVFVEKLTLSSIRQAKTDFETTDLRRKLARYHGDNIDCAFWGWNQAWLDAKFVDWNLEEYLPKIEIPVLLIQGEADNYGTLHQLQSINYGLANQPEQVVLPDCGHSPFRDRPAETLQAILRFLENHFPRRRG